MSRRGFFVKTHIPGLDEVIPGFPRGGLVLVSGPPGSGKTILGMSYIYYGAVNAQEPGLYASMFESKERFLKLANGLGMDFENLMKKGLVDYLQLPMALETGATSAVDMIVDQVENLGAKRLVIDSITAIKEVFKDPSEARSLLQNIISRILEQLKCTTIIIKEGETTGRDFEEYVADAVIGLERTLFENRRLRILKIQKLRGAEVRTPRLCFTIHKGVRVLPPTELMMPRELLSPEQVKQALPPDPPKGYTTGIPDLDREIGGLQDGSITLLELSPKLTARTAYNLILASLVVNYVEKGRPCLIVPPGGVSSKDLNEMLWRYGVSEKERRHLVRIVEIEKLKPPAVKDRTFLIEQFTNLLKSLEKEAGKPPLKLIGMDRAADFMGEEVIPVIYRAVDELRERGGLAVWIVTPTYQWIVNRLAPLADVHLKITRMHGCVLLYGVKPRTPLYAIQPDPTSKTPIPNLIPIV